MILGRTPASWEPPFVDGQLVGSRILVTTIPGSLKPIPRNLETEIGGLVTEKKVHGIHGTLGKGLPRILPSLVAPTSGAVGF